MLRTLLWILTLAAVWLLLTSGNLTSWLVGIPFIALAVFSANALKSAGSSINDKIYPSGVFRFLVFFVRESLSGAINVARSAMFSMNPIESCLHDYEISIKNARAQQLFMMSISLVPGTLCVHWKDRTARIHVLDKNVDYLKGVRDLEIRVGAIFGEQYDHQ